jgi:hypothetical protein
MLCHNAECRYPKYPIPKCFCTIYQLLYKLLVRLGWVSLTWWQQIRLFLHVVALPKEPRQLYLPWLLGQCYTILLVVVL